jgi:hypothetical protein
MITYQRYLKDTWAMFLEEASISECEIMTKGFRYRHADAFDNVKDSCDIFAMHYANAVVDIPEKYDEAKAIYQRLARQESFVGAFAAYNLAIITIKYNPNENRAAVKCFEASRLRFKALRRSLETMTCLRQDSLMQVIVAMIEQISFHEEEIEQMKKSQASKDSLVDAYAVVGKSSSKAEADVEADVEADANASTDKSSRKFMIPRSILDECIELGMITNRTFKSVLSKNN